VPLSEPEVLGATLAVASTDPLEPGGTNSSKYRSFRKARAHRESHRTGLPGRRLGPARHRRGDLAVSPWAVRLWHQSLVRQSRPLLRVIDLVQRESVQVSPATRQLMALARRTLLEKVSPKQAVPDVVWRE
jgi:hypothetical protein